MDLGDLITTLEAADPTLVVDHGFTNPHSYRGDYYDLAFEPATTVSVHNMLTAARSALGTTYQGYKGGDFTMTADTWCWLSEYGDASGETISPLALQAMLAGAVAPAAAPSASAGRAAEWHAAADELDSISDQFDTGRCDCGNCALCAWRDAAKHLRRKADEAQPDTSRWLHVTITNPDPATANRSALSIRAFLLAEFGDSIRLRVDTDARDLDAEQQAGEAQQSDTDRLIPLPGIRQCGNDCPCRQPGKEA